MRNKLTLILLATLSFLIPTVRADVIVPFSFVTIPFYPLFLIVELIIFWVLANKIFSIKIGFWKSLLIVAVANIVTSLIGTFIPAYRDFNGPILIAFIASVIVEFIIFSLFFMKRKVKKINLFWISGIVNIVSYVILYIIFMIFG
tara:strand:- start:591 stop:1025 length:435 start_codon:yes stop_codon:yes gene_type:complete